MANAELAPPTARGHFVRVTGNSEQMPKQSERESMSPTFNGSDGRKKRAPNYDYFATKTAPQKGAFRCTTNVQHQRF